METTTPLVITISRQKGCGGAYLGQKLAKALEIAYLDRELVAEIAKKLDTSIEYIEAHDERLLPIWESMIESFSLSNPWLYSPPGVYTQTFDVSQVTTATIVKMAAEKSVVIVGRGSSYLLRNHPRHVSILLYANKHWRIKRIQEVYDLTAQEATRLIERTDIERAKYNKALSGIDMYDATQYHLALDTGVLGLDNAEALILDYVRTRFSAD